MMLWAFFSVPASGNSNCSQFLIICRFSCLDLSDNQIHDVEFVSVLQQMPNLRVLYLKGWAFHVFTVSLSY